VGLKAGTGRSFSGVCVLDRRAAALELSQARMTALDDEATRREALATGCIAYLKKPFAAELLMGAIAKIG
jgi:DNA-binding response OmpR family regulator